MSKVNDKRIKVLFTINNLNIGGAEKLVVEQINNLDQKVFDPWLVTLLPEKDSNLRNLLSIELQKRREMKFRGIFDPRSFWSFYRFLRAEKFDAVVSNLFFSNFQTRLAAFLARVPAVFAYEHNDFNRKTRLQNLIDYPLSLITDKIIVVSGDMLENASRMTGIAVNKFKLIYNGINTDSYNHSNLLPQRVLREKYQLPNDGLLLVSCGRFVEQKNFFKLIEIFDYVLKKIKREKTAKKVFLAIFGDGHLKKDVSAKIVAMGLEQEIFLPGFIPTLEIMSLTDIFVLPSLWEGLPMTLIEAMAAGKPLVATDVSGSREIVKNGVNGFLVKVNDVVGTGDKICDLVENENMRKTFGEQSNLLAERFSIKTNVKNLASCIIEELNSI